MKSIIIIFLLNSFSAKAQINYSNKIPSLELNLFKQLEKTLKAKAFTQPKVIYAGSGPLPVDTCFAEYKSDLIFYSNILQQFTDTALIKDLPELESLSPEQTKQSVFLMKNFTSNSIVSMHNVVTCVKNDLLFVMPASEYKQKDTADSRFINPPENLYVAGFYKESYYYPLLAFQFTKETHKIIYITLILNFDDYTRQKEEYFNKNISPLVEPCMRKFGDPDYDKIQEETSVPTTIQVDN